MSLKVVGIGLVVAAVVVVGLVLAAGDDEGESSSTTDAAFIEEMAPHHQAAIEMAEVAQRRAEHPEIETLAGEIIKAQTQELRFLEQMQRRLGSSSADSLGMSSGEMGMEMDAGELEKADPFDREFIDMMVAHHQGAILMAQMELAEGSDEQARALAREIVSAQSAEIEEMNRWRTEWYGSPSPAGGVPDAAASSGDHSEMGH